MERASRDMDSSTVDEGRRITARKYGSLSRLPASSRPGPGLPPSRPATVHISSAFTLDSTAFNNNSSSSQGLTPPPRTHRSSRTGSPTKAMDGAGFRSTGFSYSSSKAPAPPPPPVMAKPKSPGSVLTSPTTTTTTTWTGLHSPVIRPSRSLPQSPPRYTRTSDSQDSPVPPTRNKSRSPTRPVRTKSQSPTAPLRTKVRSPPPVMAKPQLPSPASSKPRSPPPPVMSRPRSSPQTHARARPHSPPPVLRRPRSPPYERRERPRTPPSPVGERPGTPPSPVRQRPRRPPSPVWQRPLTPPSPVVERPRTPPSPVVERPRTPPSPVVERPHTPPSPGFTRPRLSPPRAPARTRMRTPPDVSHDVSGRRSPPLGGRARPHTPPSPDVTWRRTSPLGGRARPHTPPSPDVTRRPETPPSPVPERHRSPLAVHRERPRRSPSPIFAMPPSATESMSWLTRRRSPPSPDLVRPDLDHHLQTGPRTPSPVLSRPRSPTVMATPIERSSPPPVLYMPKSPTPVLTKPATPQLCPKCPIPTSVPTRRSLESLAAQNSAKDTGDTPVMSGSHPADPIQHIKVIRRFVNPDVPGYVGFANLPNQVHRKSVKKGFEFTLMVVGESGLGKSTLVNSLFLTDLYPERQIPGAAEKIEKTLKIEASTVEIEERGVKLRLTVVDTPGFADALNNDDCFKTIIKYSDEQFERYLHDESGLNRRHIVDNRVHCCFYFVNPAGHGLKPLDVSFMKAIHHKVNIVPVIAKADTLTKVEVMKLKAKIMRQIEENGINCYPLPDCDEDEDEDYKEQCKQLKEAVPFAVVGANQVIEIRGRKVRGRMYPWGVVEVENPDHCDFIKLRTMLVTHMQDLQEVTQEIHYENFRSEKLATGNGPVRKPNSLLIETEKEDRLTQKEHALAEKEAELKRMQEMLSRMQAEMHQSQRQKMDPPPEPPSRPPIQNGHAPTVNNNTKAHHQIAS